MTDRPTVNLGIPAPVESVYNSNATIVCYLTDREMVVGELSSNQSHTHCVWYLPVVTTTKPAFHHKSQMTEICSYPCRLQCLCTSDGDMCRDE